MKLKLTWNTKYVKLKMSDLEAHDPENILEKADLD